MKAKTIPSRPSTEGSDGRNADGEAGFTLMELLIVIVVLGVLAGIVVFALGGSQRPGRRGCMQIGCLDASRALYRDYNAETGGQPPVTAALLTTGNHTYLHSMPYEP